ncbi:hypothetical protein [Streptomyces sp. NPDC000410]|uniref:hypothetical protein n=1 Tax=Streptomyces sp. NPDC000410 TaxID=3154254 RepID=UPI00332578D7
MEYTHLAAECLAQETLPGFGERRGHHDAWQARDRANWLVAGTKGEITVGRVDEDPSRVFAWQRRWPSPQPGRSHGFASPLPDGGLAVSGSGIVTVYEADGRVRWTYEHEPWFDHRVASGACVADPSGRRLLVTMPGLLETEGPYPGDLCVALDLADDRRVAATLLPSASAGYSFQQSLTDPTQIFLNAAMGDTFHSLLVTLENDVLRVRPVGLEDEPFAGLSLNGAFLKLDVGGEWLSRYEAGQPDVSAHAEDVLPEDLCFVGYHPGFLDADRVLVAIAEDQDSEDNRHLILDGHTLQPVAELDYPGASSFDPLALGDGTWLTVDGDTVRRWRTA